MQLREPIHKTNNFFCKTFQNLKSFFFGEYPKLPKTLLLNPFSCSICRSKSLERDNYYTTFLNGWESDLEKACKRRKTLEEPLMEQDANQGPITYEQKESVNQQKKPRASGSGKRGEKSNQKKMKEGDYASLAKKMKELDMMDVGDTEHALDVEEALHYYSRLKSPVYIGIVDNFFTDMYSELSLPQASSASIKNSKRRRRSLKL